jgi:hypothetical protein
MVGVEEACMTVLEGAAHSVRAPMTYVVRGEKAIFYPTDRKKSYWPTEMHEVSITDVRPNADQLSFERNGFVLLNEPSAVRTFYDAGEVERVYIPEVIALIKRLTGAAKVITFGTMLRSNDPNVGDGRLPSFGAHVDYGDRTVRQTSKDILGEEEAEKWLMGRYMLINVWRPIRTVERVPLALCDASTVERKDLFESEVRGGLGDPGRPSLYGFNLAYNPAHRWYYVPKMRPEEVLAFKLFDSDPSQTQWTAHSAFEDPETAPDAPARESIELRTIAFLGA